MEIKRGEWRRALISRLAVGLTASLAAAHACTIFVLTDSGRTLFCNNEDFSNSNTRLWFVPAGEGYLGCAYVGFDDGWAQGGVNTKGLACDWVAGWNDEWKRARRMKTVRGNSSQRMLESCSTVPEAIAFYREHWEPSFAQSRILIADRSGASVIIGAEKGKLKIETSGQCRGFGYARKTVEQALTTPPAPTVKTGMEILRSCRQEGQFATKYANIFDLSSGEIFIQPNSEEPEAAAEVQLNLEKELKKGPHYYDLPKLHEQISKEPMALAGVMKRFYLDDFKAIQDTEPEVTKRVQMLMKDAVNGKSREQHYSTKLWPEIAAQREAIQKDLKKFGRFVSAELVQRAEQDGARAYLYKLYFKKATILQRYVFDADRKLTFSQTEGFEFATETLLSME